MTESEVIEKMRKLLEVAKDYETTTRITHSLIKSVPKEKLWQMRADNIELSQILEEYEIVYNRIQKEI
ncbi:hypothetical protein GCM10022217_16100 [Chryseobacterium ginsenosidimutans]|uniref:hypothetical protein n=1 Tax=Chryseobacterium ginsenosidimutans TaxID=687846 RepID=UPI0031DB37D0